MTSGRVQHPGRIQHSGRVHYSRRMYIRARGMMDVLRRGNLGVLLLPLLLLAAGWAARARLTRKTITYRWHGVELSHPVGWTVVEQSADRDAGDSVVLTDLLGPGRIKPRVTMRLTPIPAVPRDGAGGSEAADPGEATTPAAEAPAQPPDGVAPPPTRAAVTPVVAETLVNRLPLYYEIGSAQVQIGTIGATRIDAAFAFTPRAVPGRKGDIPVVMRSIDLVLLRGADALSVQVAAPIEDFETQRPVLDAMLASLRVDPGTAARAESEPEPPSKPDVPRPGEAEEGANAVTVTGQVVDAESSLPVPGAIVLFVAPGTRVDDLTDDNLTEAAYTTGLADSSGHFTSTRLLARPAHYGMVVVADGYRWIGTDDGVAIESTTPDHLNVGPIGLRRR